MSGLLVGQAGASLADHWSISGSVTLVGKAGSYTAHAGRSGRFSLYVPPGAYHIVGRPAHLAARFQSPYLCGNQRVFVQAGVDIHTIVYCVFGP